MKVVAWERAKSRRFICFIARVLFQVRLTGDSQTIRMGCRPCKFASQLRCCKRASG